MAQTKPQPNRRGPQDARRLISADRSLFLRATESTSRPNGYFHLGPRLHRSPQAEGRRAHRTSSDASLFLDHFLGPPLPSRPANRRWYLDIREVSEAAVTLPRKDVGKAAAHFSADRSPLWTARHELLPFHSLALSSRAGHCAATHRVTSIVYTLSCPSRPPECLYVRETRLRIRGMGSAFRLGYAHSSGSLGTL